MIRNNNNIEDHIRIDAQYFRILQIYAVTLIYMAIIVMPIAIGKSY